MDSRGQQNKGLNYDTTLEFFDEIQCLYHANDEGHHVGAPDEDVEDLTGSSPSSVRSSVRDNADVVRDSSRAGSWAPDGDSCLFTRCNEDLEASHSFSDRSQNES